MISLLRPLAKKVPLTAKSGFLVFIGALMPVLWITNFYSSPQVFLWAWERPENFLFLEDSSIGVAVYAGSVELTESGLQTKRRLQTIKLQPYTPVIPVVRIDNLRRDKHIRQGEVHEMSSFIVQLCTFRQVAFCQIDFEPRVSEREVYKQLIQLVRRDLPSSVSLSTTALVSYCNQNSWLVGLDIQEIVPMFYSLGADEETIRTRLANNSFTQADICERAIGISTDDVLPPAEYVQGKRIYVFHPTPWNKESFSDIMTKLRSL